MKYYLSKKPMICSVLLVISIQPSARGEERIPPTQRELYLQGRQHFEQRQYQHAADAFTAAYQLNPIPGLLQNAGAAHAKLAEDESLERDQRLAHAHRARSLFEQYLSLPGHTGDAATEARIRRLGELQATLSAVPPVPPAAAAPSPPPLHRRPWFIALLVTLGSAAAGGAVTAAFLSPRAPQPPPNAQIIDVSQAGLALHF